MAYVPVMKKIEKLGLKPILRMARAKAVSTYRQINDFFVSMLLNYPQNGSSLILCLLISIWQQSFEVTYPPPPRREGVGALCAIPKKSYKVPQCLVLQFKIISADVLFCSHMNSLLRCSAALPYPPPLEWNKGGGSLVLHPVKQLLSPFMPRWPFKSRSSGVLFNDHEAFRVVRRAPVKSIRTKHCSKLPWVIWKICFVFAH